VGLPRSRITDHNNVFSSVYKIPGSQLPNYCFAHLREVLEVKGVQAFIQREPSGPDSSFLLVFLSLIKFPGQDLGKELFVAPALLPSLADYFVEVDNGRELQLFGVYFYQFRFGVYDRPPPARR
jgi:hypothetical protein